MLLPEAGWTVVFAQPWPASVTPPVTFSCASMRNVPRPSVTIPWLGAAASIASWIASRVAAAVSPGRIASPGSGGAASVVKLPLVAAPIAVSALLEIESV